MKIGRNIEQTTKLFGLCAEKPDFCDHTSVITWLTNLASCGEIPSSVTENIITLFRQNGLYPPLHNALEEEMSEEEFVYKSAVDVALNNLRYSDRILPEFIEIAYSWKVKYSHPMEA